MDGLRGFAVAAVLVAHLEAHYGSGGMVGVDVFFALSGFLITTLMLEEHNRTGRVSFRGFYRRRAARLLPALAVFLLATVLAVSVTGIDEGVTLKAVPAVTVYAANWWIATGHNAAALGHTWSLAVEEQFYLVWPLLLVAAMKVSRRLVGLLALAGTVTALLQRLTVCEAGSCVTRVYHSTDTRMDQLLLGALTAVAFNTGILRHVPRRIGSAAGAGALVALAVFVASSTSWSSHWYDTIGMTITAGLACVVIAAVLVDPAGWFAAGLSWRPLAVLGMTSYAVYLWNALFLVLLRDGTSMPVWTRGLCMIALTAAAAAISWRFVELPILRRARAGRGLRDAGRSHLELPDKNYEPRAESSVSTTRTDP